MRLLPVTDEPPLFAIAQKGAASLLEIRQSVGTALRTHSIEIGGAPEFERFLFATAYLEDIVLASLRYGMETAVTVPPYKDFHLVKLTLAGHARIVSGQGEHVLRPGSLFMMNPNDAYRKEWSADCLQLIIRFDAATLPLRPDGGLTRYKNWPRAGTERAVRRLSDLLLAICADADVPERGSGERKAAGQGYLAPGVASQTRKMVVALVRQIFERAPQPAAETLYSALVRRAQSFVHLYFRQPIGPRDIAAAVKVSDRVLQKTFAMELGLSPTAYLRRVRLAKARIELSDRIDRATSVTDVAFACGFTHLSKFARDYRRRYGERPSETLRRGKAPR